MDRVTEQIIAIQRSALDRWINFDPQGYLDLCAAEVTYFDPIREKRVDGLEAMRTVLAPLKNFKGSIKNARYEISLPRCNIMGTWPC